MSFSNEITKIRMTEDVRSRIYIFIKALIAIAVFLNVVENLSPCNKALGKTLSFYKPTHTFQL